jgi:DNA primase
LKEKLKSATHMTIPEIKAALPIATVLAHYGLEAGAKGSMRCPFHDDEAASMKIYRDTNTAYCFAGGCEVKNVDVIDFIMRMEKSTKREAILKAKAMCGETLTKPTAPLAPPSGTGGAKLNLSVIYEESINGMERTPSGREYCTARGLETNGVGYRSRKAKEKWGRGCIIFPLVNEGCKVVGLYGRAVKGRGHYYTADRAGLYPEYPDPTTATLLLTESVIDAASIVGILDSVTVLALYGTNGLTAEHRHEIKTLGNLQEVVLALDGDEAGRKATGGIAAELKALRPGLKVTTLDLPDGEDINGMWVSHADEEAGWLQDLYKGRRVIGEEEQVPNTEVKPDSITAIKAGLGKLTIQPHYLEYLGIAARYRVRGGIRGGAESLKVSLQIQSTGQDYRAKVDLYEYKQTMTLAERTASVLELRKDQVLDDLRQLTDLLEVHRDNPAPSSSASHPRPRQNMLPGERAAVLAFLKRPDLLDQLGDYLGRAGIVGETRSRQLLYLVALSHGTDAPLHALVQGTSGSGKTHLVTKISELLPPEDVITLTRVTDSSFYNYGRDDLKNKLIVLEDLDGLREDALFAFRELQSRGQLTSSTSIKDDSGEIFAKVRTVKGPVASLAATTQGEIYEDNLSRCLVVAVDESEEQTRAVVDYQNRRAAGLVDGAEERSLRDFLRSCATAGPEQNGG